MNLPASKNVKGRFLMKSFPALVVSVILFLVSNVAWAFETGVPEEQGVSSRAILDWIDSVESNVDALHSFVLVRHGKVIAEGKPEEVMGRPEVITVYLGKPHA